MKKTIIDILLITTFISGICVLVCVYAYQKDNIEKRMQHTNYRATINNKVVVCNLVEHTKLGYNMSKCENGRQYFNVTNIEMVSGEK